MKIALLIWATLTAYTFLAGVLLVMTDTARRAAAAVSLVIVAGIIGFTGSVTILGYPAPVIPGITALPDTDARVLGVKMIVDQGIYVLLDGEGTELPRYYALPWSEDTARALENLMADPDNTGKMMMRLPPFEWSWDVHEAAPWALPQEKTMPDKPAARPAPRIEG